MNRTTKKPTKSKTTTKRTKTTGPRVVSMAGKSLVIVESPTKARTLNKYLDNSYFVMATGGHIIDLPLKEIGVDVENGYEPKFKLLPGKAKIAKALAEAARDAKDVFIATDPDREGEAIAWHIKELVSSKRRNGVKRVQFHEITKSSVQAALDNPGEIDNNKVEAQFARRIMDRLVGYQVSPILWKTIARGLSAGRVQSVALRMICERDVEIEAFKPVEYWSIHGHFDGENVDEFRAKFAKFDGKKVEIGSEDEARTILNVAEKLQYRILDLKKTRKKRRPSPPFITSTLQQSAGRRLGFTVKRTMAIAQQLYEGINLGAAGQTGLITYMRTDSTRIAGEAIGSLRDWLADTYGSEYLSTKPRVFKNKKSTVQDAHEAIRPTDVTLTPDKIKSFLSPEQAKLYDLIWRRFVATQMQDAAIDVTTVAIGDGKRVEFRASGQIIVFSGFLTVFEDMKKIDDSSDNGNPLPKGLIAGMPLILRKTYPQQHFTQPPPRFNEASLVKELDEKGIGRPSTYASIISTLVDRKYVDREKKVFMPTELGKTVNFVLVAQFPNIFNIKFTAEMENELDRVEEGGDWRQIMDDFYQPFSKALKIADKERQAIKKEMNQPVGRPCPDCGSDLIFKWGRRGRFISCSNYPECKHSENIESDGKPIEVDVKCPKCGSPMQVRDGRFGKFIGCTQYPKCKGILPLSTGHKCPREDCKGDLSERRTKRGRTFYGCSEYPKCDFMVWDVPQSNACPECSAPTTFEKTNKQGTVKYCARCDWKLKE